MTITSATGDAAATTSTAEPAAVAPGPSRDRVAGTPPAAEPRTESEFGAVTAGLPQLLTIAGSVVAPTTLLTSLLFYFGWSHSYWFFDYFGVNSTLLGLTTQDYLMRSLDGLFVPLTAATAGALLVLWGPRAFRVRLQPGARARQMLLRATAITGVFLCLVGLSRVFGWPVFDAPRAVYPLCLVAGVLLLLRAAKVRPGDDASQPRSGSAVLEWAAVFMLVGLGLFWAANDYSAAVGQSRARQFLAHMPTYAKATVYSSQRLSLDAPGVRELRCQDPEAAYRFRYDGLVLMLQSGDQYLFLPEAWTRTGGVTVLLPKTDSLRLEFTPRSAANSPSQDRC